MPYYVVRTVDCDEFNARRIDVFTAFNSHHPQVALPFIPSVFGVGDSDMLLLVELGRAFYGVANKIDPLHLMPPASSHAICITEHAIRFTASNGATISRIRNHFFFSESLNHAPEARELATLCMQAWLYLNHRQPSLTAA